MGVGYQCLAVQQHLRLREFLELGTSEDFYFLYRLILIFPFILLWARIFVGRHQLNTPEIMTK